MNVICRRSRRCGGGPPGAAGVCPAIDRDDNGVTSAGYEGDCLYCALTGDCCQQAVRGMSARNIDTCAACEFYRSIRQEKGKNFRIY